jgi:ribosomal-protein-alanine N-acetyltransferase
VAARRQLSKVGAVPELQRLRAGHAPAVLAFELANRAYFAAFISDRGDEFFVQFTQRLDALLAEQEAGRCACYVLAGDDGSVLGRFNLYDIRDGTAVLGYRVAEHVAGRGVATAAVRELCSLAAAQHGLRTLRAATSHDNVASQKVLAKAGFRPAGPADPAGIGGKPGSWYQRDLAAAEGPMQSNGHDHDEAGGTGRSGIDRAGMACINEGSFQHYRPPPSRFRRQLPRLIAGRVVPVTG